MSPKSAFQTDKHFIIRLIMNNPTWTLTQVRQETRRTSASAIEKPVLLQMSCNWPQSAPPSHEIATTKTGLNLFIFWPESPLPS